MVMGDVTRFFFTKTLGPDKKHSEKETQLIGRKKEKKNKKKNTNLLKLNCLQPELISNCIESELKSSRHGAFRSSLLKPYNEYKNFSK
jgi:hypothetical protein